MTSYWRSQAGLLVGRAEIIERMRSHSLYRALRADKFRITALEATLDAYARGATDDEIPTHRMIALSLAELKSRADQFIDRIAQRNSTDSFQLELIEGESAIGGGAAPTSQLPTALISITSRSLTANQIEESLRRSTPPVIARIEDDRVLLDLRTVSESEESELEAALVSLVR